MKNDTRIPPVSNLCRFKRPTLELKFTTLKTSNRSVFCTYSTTISACISSNIGFCARKRLPWGGSYSVGAVRSEILRLALTVLEIFAKTWPICSSFGVDILVNFQLECGPLKCHLRAKKLAENWIILITES